MKNVLRIFKRDVLRLFKAPAALVVVIALIVLPSLYTWFNVVGFWSPYENTENLRVCVVNEDKGAYTEVTGELNLGDQIVEEIKTNTEMGWVFTDREAAMQEVQAGKAYAAFIIPADFSRQLSTLFTGDFEQPQLEYYVNEKLGAVAPKITDTGATVLDQTINSAFVSTVSSLAADAINQALAETELTFDSTRASIAALFDDARNSITLTQSSIDDLALAVDETVTTTTQAQTDLQASKEDLALLALELQQLSDLIATIQNDMGQFSARMFSVLDKGSLFMSQIATKTNASIGLAATAIVASQGNVAVAIQNGQIIAAQNDTVITQLKNIQEALPDSDPSKAVLAQTIATLETQNAALKQTLADLETLSAETQEAAEAVILASDNVNTATQGALDNAATFRTTLANTAFPAINAGLTQLAGTSSSLSAIVTNQTLIVDQGVLALGQLTQTLYITSSALTQTDDMLDGLSAGIDTAQTDLMALSTSGSLADLIGSDSFDASKIADFMLSPTELRTESLYSINAYGAAMLPLFMNLTLWIGVFMLMVILKQGVDDEGIKDLQIWQRYLGRWLLLAPFAMLQAVVCCTGSLIIGVHFTSVPLFYVTAMVASLTYLSIQYALSITLQHVGKGICIVLVFVQIPGATGLYPIEMTPAFFQAVYPFFPFTYGIDAMRETIAGFYQGQWLFFIAILLLFLVISFAFGLLVRPYLTNVNRMFARQIKESDILNGEAVHLPERQFRLGQLMRVIANRDEYRMQVRARLRRFAKRYPQIKRGLLVFGVMVPTVATIVISIITGEKVILLTAWLIWLVIIVVAAIVVEYIRDNLERKRLLENFSTEELQALFLARGKSEKISQIRKKTDNKEAPHE